MQLGHHFLRLRLEPDFFWLLVRVLVLRVRPAPRRFLLRLDDAVPAPDLVARFTVLRFLVPPRFTVEFFVVVLLFTPVFLLPEFRFGPARRFGVSVEAASPPMTAPTAGTFSRENFEGLAGLDDFEREIGCFFPEPTFFVGLRFPVPDFEVPVLAVPRGPRLRE